MYILIDFIMFMSVFEDYRAFGRNVKNDSLENDFALSVFNLKTAYLRLFKVGAFFVTAT